MIVGYFSFFIFLILIVYTLLNSPFFKLENLSGKLVLSLFTIKLLAAFALYFLYTFYYTERANADIFRYFDDAQLLFQNTESDYFLRWQIIFGFQDDTKILSILDATQYWYSQGDLFFNDNRTMTRIHLVLLHLSQGVYHLHILFFAFISFVGSFGIFRFFNKPSSIPNNILAVIVFLVPSFLFWTSAPLKESLLIFGLGFFLYGCFKLSRSWLLHLLVGLFILLSIKLYIFVSLLPALVFYLISLNQNRKKTVLLFLLSHLPLLLILLVFQNEIVSLLSNKLIAFKELAFSMGANSTISSPNYHTLGELFAALPHALFNVFLQPIFPPKWNILSAITALEHLFFCCAFLLPFLYYKKVKWQEMKLFLFCCSFIIIAGSIIGLTTSVLGAIVRYKAPLIPFYLVLIFTFVDFSKLPIPFK